LEDFTVQETFNLHFKLKQPKISLENQWEIADLKPFLNKKYSELSSGLKNKVKLSLAIFTDTPALLLDEPCTNFDDKNIDWYNKMLEKFGQDQLIIIASNQESEYKICKEHLYLNHYKSN
jgi:ABC-type multidrug transport system ATPase subunit